MNIKHSFTFFLIIVMSSLSLHSMGRPRKRPQHSENFAWMAKKNKQNDGTAASPVEVFTGIFKNVINSASFNQEKVSTLHQLLPQLSPDDLNRKINTKFYASKTPLQLLTQILLNFHKNRKQEAVRQQIKSLMEKLVLSGANPALKDEADTTDQSPIDMLNPDFFTEKWGKFLEEKYKQYQQTIIPPAIVEHADVSDQSPFQKTPNPLSLVVESAADICQLLTSFNKFGQKAFPQQ